jgi:hypothetical protein
MVKYGDGEEQSARGCSGKNCNDTPYTPALARSVRESFLYNIQQTNSMIGKWYDCVGYWEELASTIGASIPYVDNGTALFTKYDNPQQIRDKIELYKAIRNSSMRKIYVANELHRDACPIFRIDHLVEIHRSNWFEQSFDDVLAQTRDLMDPGNTLVLVSAGIGGKYLITELHRSFPTCLYIDIGSGFDKIVSGINTRDYFPSDADLRARMRMLEDPETL